MYIKHSLRILEPSLDIFYEGVELGHLISVDEAPLALLRHVLGLSNILSS